LGCSYQVTVIQKNTVGMTLKLKVANETTNIKEVDLATSCPE